MWIPHWVRVSTSSFLKLFLVGWSLCKGPSDRMHACLHMYAYVCVYIYIYAYMNLSGGLVIMSPCSHISYGVRAVLLEQGFSPKHPGSRKTCCNITGP